MLASEQSPMSGLGEFATTDPHAGHMSIGAQERSGPGPLSPCTGQLRQARSMQRSGQRLSGRLATGTRSVRPGFACGWYCRRQGTAAHTVRPCVTVRRSFTLPSAPVRTGTAPQGLSVVRPVRPRMRGTTCPYGTSSPVWSSLLCLPSRRLRSTVERGYRGCGRASVQVRPLRLARKAEHA